MSLQQQQQRQELGLGHHSSSFSLSHRRSSVEKNNNYYNNSVKCSSSSSDGSNSDSDEENEFLSGRSNYDDNNGGGGGAIPYHYQKFHKKRRRLTGGNKNNTDSWFSLERTLRLRLLWLIRNTPFSTTRVWMIGLFSFLYVLYFSSSHHRQGYYYHHPRVLFNNNPSSSSIGTTMFKQNPRMVSSYYYYDDHISHDKNDDSVVPAVQTLDPNAHRRRKKKQKRNIHVPVHQQHQMERLEDDRRYPVPDPVVPEGCEPLYEWQTQHHPVCNNLHEVDLPGMIRTRSFPVVADDDAGGTTTTSNKNNKNYSYHIANGGFRDVWKIYDSPTANTIMEDYNYEYVSHDPQQDPMVVKTLNWMNEFRPRLFDRHVKDAAANDKLAFSKYISPIYGFCGMSGLYEFAQDGTIENLLFHGKFDVDYTPNRDRPPLSNRDKLVLAFQVVTSIADLHNTDEEGNAAFSHTDIYPNQWIYSRKDQIFKLNDFNRGRFLGWNQTSNQQCGFEVETNRGRFRSPEEYNYEVETEKIDVYSMGNMLYTLLTGLFPFQYFEEEKAQAIVGSGKRPKIPTEYLDSNELPVQGLLKCIYMCWEQDPTKRASAREVQRYLLGVLKNAGVVSRHHDDEYYISSSGKINQKIKFIL